VSAIELLGVEKRYGDAVAVMRTDLRIPQGELVTLLGPSGSGKSTILAMIAGITPPSAGQIRIGARDVTRVPAAQRNLGMMFQSYALFPHLCVFDNVAFPLRIRNVPKTQIRARVMQILAQVQLDERLYARHPTELSGGQQQRVALARALVFHPDILLLDEPMGALDKKLREEVQLQIKQLQRELGVTTVMVTHDQEEALSMSTRLVILNHGQVQQIAEPTQAYREPANRFVAEFIGTANLFAGEGGAHVMVRPEHLRLYAQPTPGRLAAQVMDHVYLGQTTRVHLQTPSGQTLVAVTSHQDGTAPAKGQTVYIDWAGEHGWILPP